MKTYRPDLNWIKEVKEIQIAGMTLQMVLDTTMPPDSMYIVNRYHQIVCEIVNIGSGPETKNVIDLEIS